MILKQRLDSLQVRSLIDKLTYCLDVYSCVEFWYNTDTRSFSVLGDSHLRAATIEEERAFALGGSHSALSECSL